MVKIIGQKHKIKSQHTELEKKKPVNALYFSFQQCTLLQNNCAKAQNYEMQRHFYARKSYYLHFGVCRYIPKEHWCLHRGKLPGHPGDLPQNIRQFDIYVKSIYPVLITIVSIITTSCTMQALHKLIKHNICVPVSIFTKNDKFVIFK